MYYKHTNNAYNDRPMKKTWKGYKLINTDLPQTNVCPSRGKVNNTASDLFVTS